MRQETFWLAKMPYIREEKVFFVFLFDYIAASERVFRRNNWAIVFFRKSPNIAHVQLYQIKVQVFRTRLYWKSLIIQIALFSSIVNENKFPVGFETSAEPRSQIANDGILFSFTT